MQFSIAKDTFLKALQKVQGIIETRKTMPILSNVLIEARRENRHNRHRPGSRYESSYEASVKEEGKITVSAKNCMNHQRTS